MSKAEGLSKQYREFREQCGIKDTVMLDEIEEAYLKGYNQAEEDIADKARFSSGWDGFYYGKGYEQAKKDLELTWDDIKNLENLCIQKRVNDGLFDKEDYQEVLKQFKDYKGRKKK